MSNILSGNSLLLLFIVTSSSYDIVFKFLTYCIFSSIIYNSLTLLNNVWDSSYFLSEFYVTYDKESESKLLINPFFNEKWELLRLSSFFV